MKTKLILLASLSLLFSCATKSIVADTSKTVAPAEIKVVQEAAPAQNSVIPETKPIRKHPNKFTTRVPIGKIV